MPVNFSLFVMYRTTRQLARERHQPIRTKQTSRGLHQPFRTRCIAVEQHQPIRTKQTAMGQHQPNRTKQTAMGRHQPIRTRQTATGHHQPIRTRQKTRESHQPIRTRQKARGRHQPIRTRHIRARLVTRSATCSGICAPQLIMLPEATSTVTGQTPGRRTTLHTPHQTRKKRSSTPTMTMQTGGHRLRPLFQQDGENRGHLRHSGG